MKNVIVPVGFLSALLVASLPSCSPKSDTAGTEAYNQTSSGDGCANAPASFKDGVAFARLPNGRVAQGFMIKVVADEGNLHFGAHGGYYQSRDSSPMPRDITLADMGAYGKGSKTGYGYHGVTVTEAYANSQRGRVYNADGSDNLGAGKEWVKEGNSYSLYMEGKKVGEGRELGSQYGKKHVLFWAVNGTCFGVPAVRGTRPGVNGDGTVEMDSNGGSFLTWLGNSSQAQQGQQQQQGQRQQQQQQGQQQQQQGKQDDVPKFGGSMPQQQQQQQQQTGGANPAPTAAPVESDPSGYSKSDSVW